MESKISAGNAFRDKVALLLSAKFKSVVKEHALTGKNADIFFKEPVFPVGQRRIAVECKRWQSRTLTSKVIAQIRSEYDPAFRNNEIDALWIITATELHARPKSAAGVYGQSLQILTLQDLQNSVMDFSDYLRQLISAYDEFGLSEYYKETFTESGRNLHRDIVLPWLDRPGNPIAILGGYGIGKSSYSKRLAASLASAAIDDHTRRIPIHIKLGGLTKAQNLRELLTIQFAADYRVEGFNFPLFSVLNEMGRFVLILDGFDEMKHAMRQRDIQKNFDNICSFVNPSSKIILFGRPDPFITISDEFVLRGLNKFKSSNDIFEDPNRSVFDCYHIAMFDKTTALSFIDRYLRWNVEHNSRRLAYPSNFLAERTTQISALPAADLICRPVHAKMLADLALIPGQPIHLTNEYELYRELMARVTARETEEKDSREPIDATTRIEFITNIAWWLWTIKQSDAFSFEEIPPAILNRASQAFEEVHDSTTVAREMLIGSVLERSSLANVFNTKDQITFYFPHRSYAEFLVCEYIANLRFSGSDVDRITDTITPRIIQFLRERPDRSFIYEIIAHIVKSDLVSFEFVSLLSAARNASELKESQYHVTPVQSQTRGAIDSEPPEFSSQNGIAIDSILPELPSQSRVATDSRRPNVPALELMVHVMSCLLTEAALTACGEFVARELFSSDRTRDAAFLCALAWGTIDKRTTAASTFVPKLWKDIVARCVLTIYRDWHEQQTSEHLSYAASHAIVAHPNVMTFFENRPLHMVTQRRTAAGLVFSQAIAFKDNGLSIDLKVLVKALCSFVDKLRPASIDVEDFILSFGLHELTSDMPEQQQRDLHQIVQNKKWTLRVV
jgi:hypothetical protein